jgi:hypothetical protein
MFRNPGIRGKQEWFVELMQALISGNADSLKEINNRIDFGWGEEYEPATDSAVYCILDFLRILADSGIVRLSRKGWYTLEHSELGMVQWKWGGETSRYFWIRVNGNAIVEFSTFVEPQVTWTTNPLMSDLLGKPVGSWYSFTSTGR